MYTLGEQMDSLPVEKQKVGRGESGQILPLSLDSLPWR